MKRSVFVLLVWTAGCGGAPATVLQSAHEERLGNAPSAQDATPDALDRRMSEIEQTLAAAGVARTDQGARGFLAESQAITVPLEVPPNRCWLLATAASSGLRDVDATLFSPDGDVLAEDVEQDAHPTLAVCGGTTGRRVFYVLRAFAGAGAYAYRALVGDRARIEAAAMRLGGRPGFAGESESGAADDARLRELATGVGRRGFERFGDASRVPLDEGQEVRVPLRVEAQHCYTVGALATDGLVDLDVRVLDEEGAVVVRDETAAGDAQVQLCVDRDGDFAIELVAARGAGMALVALFRVESARLGGVSGLWLGQRRGGWAQPRSLDSEAARVDALLVRRGARPFGPRPPRFTLGYAEARTVTLALPAGCGLVVATGGRGVGRLELEVPSAGGGVRRVASRDGESTVSTHVCGPTARDEFAIIARAGAGEVAVRVLEVPVPPTAAAGPVEARAWALDVLASAADRGWTPRDRGELRAQRIERDTHLALPIAAGECVEVHVRSADVDARIVDGAELLARAGAMPIRACAAAVRASAELVLTSRTGAVLETELLVLSRPRG